MTRNVISKGELARKYFRCPRCQAEVDWPCRSLQRGAWSTRQTIKGIHEERLELVDRFLNEITEDLGEEER